MDGHSSAQGLPEGPEPPRIWYCSPKISGVNAAFKAPEVGYRSCGDVLRAGVWNRSKNFGILVRNQGQDKSSLSNTDSGEAKSRSKRWANAGDDTKRVSGNPRLRYKGQEVLCVVGCQRKVKAVGQRVESPDAKPSSHLMPMWSCAFAVRVVPAILSPSLPTSVREGLGKGSR